MTLTSQKTAAPQPPHVSFNLPGNQTTPQPDTPASPEPPLGGSEPTPTPESRTPQPPTEIPPDQKRSVILKAANEAAKVAALASEASSDYNETQEMAEDLLATADPNHTQSMEDAKSASATAHDAARCAKMAAQASQRADVLYAQIFDTTNGESPNIDTVKSLFKQLTSQTTKAEKARDKVKEYKNQVNGLSGLDI